MPGVPKFMAFTNNTNVQVPSLNEVQSKMLLPLPPGSSRNVVNVVSKRMSLWEEDPFLAAIIECTKDLDDDYKGNGEIKKNFWTGVNMSKSFLLSCKQSFDVKESHTLMKPSSLGCIDIVPVRIPVPIQYFPFAVRLDGVVVMFSPDTSASH
ncbi:hypothetical protein Tco_1343939 [Tanacetum coccineum]